MNATQKNLYKKSTYIVVDFPNPLPNKNLRRWGHWQCFNLPEPEDEHENVLTSKELIKKLNYEPVCCICGNVPEDFSKIKYK